MRERYGKNTFGQCCCSPAGWSRPARGSSKSSGRRWPTATTTRGTFTRTVDAHEEPVGPDARRWLSALIEDLDERGLLKETLVVAVGEFGRSPQRGVSTSGNENNDDGRDHWPYCYTALIAGAGINRGFVYGKSDKTASAPWKTRSTRRELLATIYHSVGIKPDTIVYNHLNQPRELVKGEVVERDSELRACRKE